MYRDHCLPFKTTLYGPEVVTLQGFHCTCLVVELAVVFLQIGTERGGFQTVLDQRRANNILIEIKRFPAARHIKAAILSMDYSYFNKEIVEVSLTDRHIQV